MRAVLWARVAFVGVGLCLAGAVPAFSSAPPALVPNSLSFSSQIVNTTSTAQSIALRNRQAVPLSISSIMVSGDFAQTNNCPQTLAKDSSCTIALGPDQNLWFTEHNSSKIGRMF